MCLCVWNVARTLSGICGAYTLGCADTAWDECLLLTTCARHRRYNSRCCCLFFLTLTLVAQSTEDRVLSFVNRSSLYTLLVALLACQFTGLLTCCTRAY